MAQIKCVAISGASGLIGAALSTFLRSKNIEVKSLVRKKSNADPSKIYWNYESAEIELEKLAGVDAVVHLAGEGIASGYWTTKKKSRIVQSRVQGTYFLASSLKKLAAKPKIFISASAIGFYGDRADERLSETSPAGRGFLADTCAAWEASSDLLLNSEVRLVRARIGLVLSKNGGMLAKMLPLFKLGLGGVLGSGKQFMSWIALQDIIRAFYFILENEALSGAVNLVSPNPVSNFEFTKTLGKALGRPTIFRVPSFILRLTAGQMADELLLSSAKVFPERLIKAGFEFEQKELWIALTA